MASIAEDKVNSNKSVRVYTAEGDSFKLDAHSEFCGDEVPTCLSISQDVFSLAVGYESGIVRIFDLSENQILKTIKSTDKSILKIYY